MTFPGWLLAVRHGWTLLSGTPLNERIKASSAVPVSMVLVTSKGKKEGLLPQSTSYSKLLPTTAVPCELQTSITSGPATTWQKRWRCLPFMRISPLGKWCPHESHPGLIWKGDGAKVSRRQCDKALLRLGFGTPWWWRASLNTTDIQRSRLVKVLSRLGTMGALYKSTSASLSSRDRDWYISTFNGSPRVKHSLVTGCSKTIPRLTLQPYIYIYITNHVPTSFTFGHQFKAFMWNMLQLQSLISNFVQCNHKQARPEVV